MARNYGDYQDDSNDNNSGSSSGSSGGNGGEDLNLTMTPFSEIEGKITKVFGNENAWGQSIGLVWEDVELVDGCLYHDPEKNKHKVFAWKDVVGMMPGEGDFSADDANQFLVKNYGGTEKKYQLVTAVHPDQDEPETIGGAVMWYSGSEQYGPKSASKTLAQILTKYGRDMVIRDSNGDVSSDVENWITDTSAENILRPDLQDRRLRFFEVKRQSNNSDRKYHHPIVEDADTGAQVTVQNATDDTQGTLGGDSAEAEAATDGGAAAMPAAQTEASIPEPINDFITSVAQFDDFTRERAEALLEDFIGDDSLPLTADLVAEFGGNDAVLEEAGY